MFIYFYELNIYLNITLLKSVIDEAEFIVYEPDENGRIFLRISQLSKSSLWLGMRIQSLIC